MTTAQMELLECVEWDAWGLKGHRSYQLLINGEAQPCYVHHCGHPTALWPYYVSRRCDGRGPLVVSFNGRGFCRLADAKRAALDFFRGTGRGQTWMERNR